MERACDLCGQKITILRRVHRKSSKSARRGRPTRLPDHDLCERCWRTLVDQRDTRRVVRDRE